MMKIKRSKKADKPTPKSLFLYSFSWRPQRLCAIALAGIGVLASTVAPFSMYADAPSKVNEAEVASLKQQLQETSKQLNDYKTRLFRPSHPEDQLKIKELTNRLAEQQLTLDQLSDQVTLLTTELGIARKQVTSLEVTADALNTMIRQHRQEMEQQGHDHQKEVAHLLASFETAKKQLENDVRLEEKDKQKRIEEKAFTLYQELAGLHAISENTQQALAKEVQKLSKQLEKEQQLSARFKNELEEAKRTLISNERHIAVLEQGFAETLASAAALDKQLSTVLVHSTSLELQVANEREQHEAAKRQLQGSIQHLEMTVADLIDAFHQSRESLEGRIADNEHLERKLQDVTGQHQMQYHAASELQEELNDAKQEIVMLCAALSDVHRLHEMTNQALEGAQTGHQSEQSQRQALEEQVAQTLNHLHEAVTYAESIERKFLNQEKSSQENLEDLAILQSVVHDMSEDNLRLQTDYAKLDKEYASLQEILSQHVADNEVMRTDIQMKDDALTAALAEYQNASDEYRTQTDDLHQKLSEAEQNRLQLQAQLDAILVNQQEDRQRSSLLQESLEQAHQELAEARQQIDHHVASLQLQESSIQQLQEQLAAAESINLEGRGELESALQAKMEENSGLQELLNSLNDQHQQLAERSVALNEQLHNSVESHHAAQIAHQQEQQRAETLMQELSEARGQLAQLKEAMEAQNALLLAGECDIAELKERLTTAESMHAQGRGELESALQAKMEENSGLQELLNSLNDQHQQLAERSVALNEQLHNSVESHHAAQIAHQQEQQRAETLMQELSEAREQLAQLKEAMEAQNALLATGENDVENLRGHLASMEMEHTQHRNQLESTLQAAYEENRELKERERELVLMVERLQEIQLDNQHLQQQVMKLSEERAEIEQHAAAQNLKSSATEAELTTHQMALLLKIEKLQDKLEENTITIEELQAVLDQMRRREQQIMEKAQHLEGQLSGYASLTDTQDKTLGEAGYALQKVQALNVQLTEENQRLKAELDQVAERSTRSSRVPFVLPGIVSP